MCICSDIIPKYLLIYLHPGRVYYLSCIAVPTFFLLASISFLFWLPEAAVVVVLDKITEPYWSLGTDSELRRME
jgi:hypothetical protein